MPTTTPKPHPLVTDRAAHNFRAHELPGKAEQVERAMAYPDAIEFIDELELDVSDILEVDGELEAKHRLIAVKVIAALKRWQEWWAISVVNEMAKE